MASDYYEILGVSRSATPAEIQKAYRALAKKFHPDLHPDDKTAKAKFQEIQQAYDVLSDADKRKKYDQFGPMFEQMGAGPQPGGGWSGEIPPEFAGFDFGQMFGGGVGASFGGGGGFEDILRQFTGAGGGASRRRGAKRATQVGSHLEHEVEIPFKVAVAGGETHLRLKRPKGTIETLTVKIPPGIETGKIIRLRGLGEPGPGDGPPGDLLVKIKVLPHPHFTRSGLDLEVQVPVTLAEAALGAKVDVPTPAGEITLTIPAGTSSGKKIRVRGHGVKAKEGTGDLYAVIQINLPKEIEPAAAELVRQLEARWQQSPRQELRW